MSIPSHVCSQINIPMCKSFNIETTVYDAFETKVLGIKIASPYALVLLILTIICAARMIAHVESIFSAIGRFEMQTVFYLYLVSNMLLLCTLCFDKNLDASTLNFLNVLQNATMSTTYFALCVSGFTTDKIYGIFGMQASTLMMVFCTIYFVLISIFIHIFMAIANAEVITLLLAMEAIFILSYLSSHMKNLRKNKGEIWGFGVLGTIFLFFAMSKVHTFMIGELVAAFSERNLDNMFFNILYTFLVIIMCHKFWLSTYDFELECLALYQ